MFKYNEFGGFDKVYSIPEQSMISIRGCIDELYNKGFRWDGCI
jgi:hypothetical protein